MELTGRETNEEIFCLFGQFGLYHFANNNTARNKESVLTGVDEDKVKEQLHVGDFTSVNFALPHQFSVTAHHVPIPRANRSVITVKIVGRGGREQTVVAVDQAALSTAVVAVVAVVMVVVVFLDDPLLLKSELAVVFENVVHVKDTSDGVVVVGLKFDVVQSVVQSVGVGIIRFEGARVRPRPT